MPLSQILLAQEQEFTQDTSVKNPVAVTAVTAGSVLWPGMARSGLCAIFTENRRWTVLRAPERGRGDAVCGRRRFNDDVYLDDVYWSISLF